MIDTQTYQSHSNGEKKAHKSHNDSRNLQLIHEYCQPGTAQQRSACVRATPKSTITTAKEVSINHNTLPGDNRYLPTGILHSCPVQPPFCGQTHTNSASSTIVHRPELEQVTPVQALVSSTSHMLPLKFSSQWHLYSPRVSKFSHVPVSVSIG